MRKKIAFIKWGVFSLANERIKHQLAKNFIDFDIEIIDVSLINAKWFMFLNLLSTLFEYLPDLLSGRRNIKSAFFRTQFFFSEARRYVLRRLLRSQYAFTFQTQSLFDVSTPGVPNFLYTDHTHLANLYYPSFKNDQLYPQSWIVREKSIYHNAAINFTMSSNISRSLIEQYGCPSNKVVCAYAGGNTISNDFASENDGYSNQSILFVGVDWERKGGPELVEAFKLVLETCPDAKLIIVGCSPNVCLQNCIVVGRVDAVALSEYYRKASVFCLPTKIEPFGFVFLEAMSYKLPIVATKIGAIPDFVIDGESGYLLASGDVRGLAAMLVKLLQDPDACSTFGRRGYEVLSGKYTWDNVGAVIKRSIDSILVNEIQGLTPHN
ncbi:MAG: glycosyltransferase family 4 protein [Candidatus Omnitrophota bacterium]